MVVKCHIYPAQKVENQVGYISFVAEKKSQILDEIAQCLSGYLGRDQGLYKMVTR